MKTLEEMLREQLGNLMFLLCVKDAEIFKFREENEALKAQIAKKEEKVTLSGNA